MKQFGKITRRLVVTVPDLRIISEANGREHWAVKRKRGLDQALRVLNALHRHTSPVGAYYTVTFTRIGPKKLDTDNLSNGWKKARDTVAKWLGIDDGDERIEWRYEQLPQGKRIYAGIIEIEAHNA